MSQWTLEFNIICVYLSIATAAHLEALNQEINLLYKNKTTENDYAVTDVRLPVII